MTAIMEDEAVLGSGDMPWTPPLFVLACGVEQEVTAPFVFYRAADPDDGDDDDEDDDDDDDENDEDEEDNDDVVFPDDNDRYA